VRRVPLGPLEPYRYELWWAAAAFVFAGAAAFVPLLGVLGYESAELFCLFAMASTPAITLMRLGDGTVSLAREGIGEGAMRLIGRSLIPLAVPPVVLLLNAFRVPNCDLLVGLLLYLLLPVATVAVAVAIVLPFAVLLRSTRWRAVAYALVVLASLVMGAAHLLMHPPIFAFHPTVGYFAGSIYDEAMSLPQGLLPFRLMSLAFVGAVVAGLEVGLRRLQGRSFAGPAVVLLLATSIWGAIYAQRFQLRIEATREAIIEELGGVVASEHFIIYYALSSPNLARQVEALVADHEFRYAQLRDFFGVEPEGPLRSFIYADWVQKERSMGAGRTLIAKPWLGEMHLTWSEVGEGHLAHEMAHLFSAAFGSGPLRLAGGGLGLDMGLIEGAAEAAAWDDRDLTGHGWAAALHALDLAPDLGRIQHAAGFWTQYSRTVYTLMGSFSRYLIAEYGADRFRRVYASGDWETAYDRPLDALVAEWRAFLQRLPLTARDIDVASFRFDRPPIFGKRCARAVAARATEGRLLAAGLRYGEAVECFADVVADDPENLEYRLEYADLLRRASDYIAAERVARGVLEASGEGRVLQARALELLADIAWTQGAAEEAAALYALVLEAPLLDDDRRRVSVKREAASDAGVRDVVFAVFLASPPPPRDNVTLALAEREAATGSWLPAYLLGLRLFEAQGYARALGYLDAALAQLDGLAASPESNLWGIRRMAWRRRGQSLYLLGRYREAAAQFEVLALSGDPLLDARAAEGIDWLERCRWALQLERPE
jgi:tetratricopeptide (TPR) repeat protein